MNQILHIFKKDVRRHCPEILVSLAFLSLYTKVTLQSPGRTATLLGGFSWSWFSAESIPPLMVVFWIFFTVRLVQGEPLVGDRQWWVTKPYDWWKLLAAKELILVIFIALPLFFVQLYLLHHIGFAVLSHLMGVLKMQFALGLVLLLPSIALGSLTRTLWQAVIFLVVALVAATGIGSLLDKIPSSSMGSSVMGATLGLLVFVSVVGSASWQYARRKTWASRGVLVVGPCLAILLSAVTPYAKFVEKSYPLAEGRETPAQFAIPPINPAPKERTEEFDVSDVYLSIPLSVSGIPDGHVVQIDGIRAYLETPGLPPVDRGWHRQSINLWAEYHRTVPTYPIKHKDYKKLKGKPVRLRIELALTEYQETGARELTLPDGKFSDQTLGLCRLSSQTFPVISCLRPLHYPSLMATFDPSTSHCEAVEDDVRIPEDHLSHAWLPLGENSTSGVLNPIEDYNISFWSPPLNADMRRKLKTVHLCPGAKVQLARPEEKGHVRVRLQMNALHFEDLVNPQLDWE